MAVMCPPAPLRLWGCVPQAAPAGVPMEGKHWLDTQCGRVIPSAAGLHLCSSQDEFLNLCDMPNPAVIVPPRAGHTVKFYASCDTTHLEHIAAVHQLCGHLALPLHHARLHDGQDGGGGKGFRAQQQRQEGLRQQQRGSWGREELESAVAAAADTATSAPPINTSPAVNRACAARARAAAC